MGKWHLAAFRFTEELTGRLRTQRNGRAARAERIQEGSDNMAEQAAGLKKTILVVEDNEMNREILCEMLSDDFTVLDAENGLAGLDRLVEHGSEIAAILLDVYMPECDGFQFLERRRKMEQYESIPVIVMTASDTVEDEIRCLELGATDFVTKPYNIAVLKNRLRSVIRLRESASTLSHLERDKLTGLYSKEYFFLQTGQTLQDHPDTKYDLICSDIENFRAMNERYGRELCDQFLYMLAEELSSHIPDLVFGGRIGADVFAFLLRHQEKDWTTALPTRSSEEEMGINCELNYGVVQDVSREVAPEVLCDWATLALRQVKGKIQVHVALYDEKLRRMQLQELQIVENAPSAIENREFKVYYQPKHSLASDRTGGAEALVRWIHPEMGFVNPGMFIPLFERNGFITRLDFYIWEEVCRELRRCKDTGLPVVPISVNVSRLDFAVPNLAGKIAELADRYGLEHELLHIELTESIYGESPDQIAKVLEELHDNGFYIELDDFGAGYSSLTSLNTLRLDVMKLDMSIIRQAAATKDYSILRFAVLLADGMRLKTVAEGVETEDQVAALKVLGCDYIQGYFYSRPLPGDQFEEYLKTHAA